MVVKKILLPLPVLVSASDCCGGPCSSEVKECVCDIDIFCCKNEWDDQCKQEAVQACGLKCWADTDPLDQMMEIRASVVDEQALEFDCERYCAAAQAGCHAEEVGADFSYPSYGDCMATCAEFPRDGTPYDFQFVDNLQCRTNHLEFVTLYGHPAMRHCPHGIGSTGAYCNKSPAAQQQYGTEQYGKQHFWSGTDLTFVNGQPQGLTELVAAVSYLASSRTRMNSYAMYPTATGTAFTGKSSQCDYNHYQKFRSYDGSCNYQEDAAMGKVHTSFSRQTRGWSAEPQPLQSTPDPYKVAPKLTRKNKADAPKAWFNQLAVAWLQFQTHDWFQHASTDPNKGSTPHETPLRNQVTHWWDGNQLYGSTYEQNKPLRTFEGGLLHLDENDELDYDGYGDPITGFFDNWWAGLHIMHTIFVREHNYVATELQRKYPEMTDEELFQTARLINSAIMAKIHTVEWTPAILDNPALNFGMHINWYGVDKSVEMLYGKQILAALGPYLKAFDGIPGIKGVGQSTYLANAPMQIPEEFVAAYRFHPLLPDEMEVDGKVIDLQTMYTADTRELVPEDTTEKFMESFGQQPAFALTLQNYPEALMKLEKPGHGTVNLAATDLMRDRSRGVPRYAEACRQMGADVPKSFEEMTDNEEDLKILKELYSDIEEVDFMVGSLATSNNPSGYGFGNLAFRIFTVMASRRLQTDRFYQEDLRAEIYTQFGMDHLESVTMGSVIARHYPKLKPLFEGKKNAFWIWD